MFRKNDPLEFVNDILGGEDLDLGHRSLRCQSTHIPYTPFYPPSECAIDRAQRARKEIDREDRYWLEQGEGGKEAFYRDCDPQNAKVFQKQDAMREVEWRIYNELAAARNRTCEVVNYFRCPVRRRVASTPTGRLRRGSAMGTYRMVRSPLEP